MEKKISIKTFILVLIIMILIITGLVGFIVNDKMNSKEVADIQQNVTETVTSLNEKIEDSKPEIIHDEETIYKEDKNKIVEENVKETQNKQEGKIYTSYIKDFFEVDTEREEWAIYSENGDVFGWEERHWPGCNSWCGVNEYNVNVRASSTLAPQGTRSYSAANVDDSSRLNAWVEGVKGNGIGEYIEINQNCVNGDEDSADFDEIEFKYEEICLVNGYAATEKNWKENNRVKELKMYCNDEYITTIVLEDTMKQQYINISEFNIKVENGEYVTFKFEIADVYEGTKYDDTCITGLLLEFSGRRAH